MIRPTITIHSTAAAVLLLQHTAQVEALRLARNTLIDNSPHMRDYQYGKDAQFHLAVQERNTMINKLQDWIEEFEQLQELAAFAKEQS